MRPAPGANTVCARLLIALMLFAPIAQAAESAADAAVRAAQEALRSGEAALGPNDASLVPQLSNLAFVLHLRGRYDEADALYRRAVPLFEGTLRADDVASNIRFASLLNNVATLAQARGDYASADASFVRAIAIREKLLGPEQIDLAVPLSNLGLNHVRRGAFDLAEPLYQRALAIQEKALGPAAPAVAKTLNNIGSLHQHRGRFAAAERTYLRAHAIVVAAYGPTHLDVVSPLNNLGELYRVRGDYLNAVEIQRRVLAILEDAHGPDHPDIALTLNNLAAAYEGWGEREQALSRYQRALDIRERLLGAAHPDVAVSLGNLAALYDRLGDPERALPLLQRSIQTLTRALGPDHPSVALALNNLGSLLQNRGERDRASKVYALALSLMERTPATSDAQIGAVLENLATLHWADGRATDSLVHAERAAEIRERQVTTMLAAGSEVEKRLFLKTVEEQANFALSLHLDALPNDERAARLALLSTWRRKGRALDATIAQMESLRRRADPAREAELGELTRLRGAVATMMVEARAADAVERRADAIRALAARAEMLEARLALDASASIERVGTDAIEAVQRALPEASALLEFVTYARYSPAAPLDARWSPPRYAVVVVRRTGVPQVVDLGAAKEIDEAVLRFVDALAERQGGVSALAAALERRLLAPIATLAGDARHWLVAPEDSLLVLPFGALVDETGRYLLQSRTLTYLTSGRDLLRLNDALAVRSSAPLVAAAPAFDFVNAATLSTVVPTSMSASTRWSPLPGTLAEAKAIAPLLDGAVLLTGQAVTERALKEIKSPRVLHVATHGFFDADAKDADLPGLGLPLARAGLALTGANRRDGGDGEDGILTALEVASLDLRGTELVVLSACETGLGSLRTNEGVFGLRRALTLAGARSQVMSFWQVEDASTRDLMVGFYERLRHGASRADALRDAQLALLADPSRSHPHYWAAFVSIGDWRALSKITHYQTTP